MLHVLDPFRFVLIAVAGWMNQWELWSAKTLFDGFQRHVTLLHPDPPHDPRVGSSFWSALHLLRPAWLSLESP
jgi:hypothetical protein